MSIPLGIMVNVNANGAVAGFRRVGTAMSQTNAVALQSNRAFSLISNAYAKTAQHLQNVVTGLNMMKNNFKAVMDITKKFSLGVVNAAADFEDSMAGLNILLGRTGEKLKDQKLTEIFENVRNKIMQIGRDTEFTLGEASEAFIRLQQSGFKTQEALESIDSIMQFTSASRGTIKLTDSVSLGSLAMKKFLIPAKDLSRTFDMFFRATQRSRLSMDELVVTMRSLTGATAKLDTTPPEEFIAFLGLMRDAGRLPAEAAQSLSIFSRSMFRLRRVFDPNEKLRKQGRDKKKALQFFGLTKEDFVDPATKNIRVLSDLMSRVGPAIQAGLAKNPFNAKDYIRTLFGTDAAVNIFLEFERLAKFQRKTISSLSAEIKNTNNDSKKAQEAYLSTLKGVQRVLFGSINLLQVTFGSDLISIISNLLKHLTQLINKTISWAHKNTLLRRVIVGVVIAIGILSAAMIALLSLLIFSSSVMLILGPATLQLGAGLTASAVASRLFVSAVAPLAGILLPFVTLMLQAAAVTSLFVFAYQKNFGGIMTFTQEWFTRMKGFFSVIFRMISGEGVFVKEWDALDSVTQNLVITFKLIADRVKDFGKAFLDTFLPVVDMALIALNFLVSTVLAVATGFGIWAGEHKKAINNTSTFADVVKVLGWVVGGVTAIFALYKATLLAARIVTLTVAAAQWLYNAAMFVAKGITYVMAFGMLLLISRQVAYAAVLSVVTTAQKAFTFAIRASRAAILANPLGILIVVLGVLAYAIYKVSENWKQITEDARIFFFGLPQWAQNTITTVGNFLVGFGEFIAYLFGQFIPGWGEILSQKWAVLWDDMKTLMSIAWKAIVEGIFVFLGAIKNGFVWVWEQFKKFGSNILTYVKTTLVDSFKNAGSKIINSLWEGMKNSWSKVKSWFGGALRGIQRFVPLSPAKEGPLAENPMDRSGMKIVRQLVGGMEAEKPLLMKTMQGITNEVSVFGKGGGTITSPVTPLSPQVTPQATNNTTNNSSLNQSQVSNKIEVNATVTTGDFKVSPESLSGADAARFGAWLAEHLGELIQDELSRRNLV